MEGAGSHTGLLGTPPFCTLSSFDIVMFSGSNTALKTFGMTWDEVTSYLKLKHQLHRHGDYGLFHNMGQIFDSLVPKTCKIKNTFGILQTNPQIPQEWVGPFYFIKNMFCWDTLIYNLKHRKNCECCPGHYLSTSVYLCLLVSTSVY